MTFGIRNLIGVPRVAAGGKPLAT
jgi:hypothetical protein